MMERIKWRIKGILAYLSFYKDVHLAKILTNSINNNPPICFIAGCGRSGTTLLGQLLAMHPNIIYLNEPRPFWFAVSKRTDIWGYCCSHPFINTLLMADPTAGEKARFKVLSGKIDCKNGLLVEKTPENVFRIPWLHGISPNSKLIYIVRNGNDVVRSILKEASFHIPYGLKDMNNWYGKNNIKMSLLATTVHDIGIDPVVIKSCKTVADWAALEWICSLRAFSRNKWLFAPQKVYELRYEDLTNNPLEEYTSLLNFLALSDSPGLLNKILEYIRLRQTPASVPDLSPLIREIFMAEQTLLGYVAPL